MKKKFLSLILAIALILSCMLALTSCPDTPDEPPVVDPELDLDETVPGGAGSEGIGVVTDPSNPEAGAGADDNYTSDKNY
ncbi:MAG: hypothetical protein IJV96_04805 [Clostridia bacterium]|nr:hypothetical protein [Clostridia bacterium]